MRKVTVIVITLAMLVSLTMVAMAEEVPTPPVPGEGLNTAMSALQLAQVEVTLELPEKARLQNEFANRRLDTLGLLLAKDKAEGFGAEVIALLLQDICEMEENLGLTIAALAKEKGEFDVVLLDELEDQVNERGWRLQEILDDGDLPEGALAGVEKALINMAAAAEKAAWALDKDDVGPPPWAGEEEELTEEPPLEVPPVTPPLGVPVGKPTLPVEKP